MAKYLLNEDFKKGLYTATDGNDEIYLNEEINLKNIKIKAKNGNDLIDVSESSGKAYVYAGLGSDTLVSNQGVSYLYGESGANTYEINRNSKETYIYAGKGKVTIDFSQFETTEFEAGFGTLATRVKNDLKITIPADGGDDRVVIVKDFYKLRGEFYIDYPTNSGSETLDLRELNLTTNIEDLKSANYTGGRLLEYIYGDERNNTIKTNSLKYNSVDGGAGNDKIYGTNNGTSIQYSSDSLAGGDGNDTIYGKDGMNLLDGGDGNDVIYGGKDADIIDGGKGNDKLYGKGGENQYIFSGGNDTIYLEKDSETLLMLNGYEIKQKSKIGNDVYIKLCKSELYGEDLKIIDEGSILLKNFFKVPEISEHIKGYKNLMTGNENEIDLFPYNELHFQASGKSTIKGTAFNDDIFGNEKANKIYTNGGNDSIDPGLGNDKIYADDSYTTICLKDGDGNDTIYGGSNMLQLLDVEDLSKLKYERVKDNLIIKYSDTDSVTLSDYFNGFKTDVEFIYNKNGTSIELFDDVIKNYTNKLTYNCGDGNVKFYAMPIYDDIEDNRNIINLTGDGFHILDGKATKKGNDLIFSNFAGKKDKITIVDYYKHGINVDLYANNTDTNITLNNLMAAESVTMTDKKYNGTYLNDYVTGTTDNDIIKTKDGHDTINASYGDDTVYAGGGNDVVNYLSCSGHKKIYGEAGNDTITTANGDDYIKGGAGNDVIKSSSGNDKIYGESGNDNIDAGDGHDTVDGGADNDTIYGGKGDDLLKGGAGNDKISGDAGNNTIYGGKGDDEIYINANTDKNVGDLVHGDAGNDYIYVQTGNNSLIYGDAGNDTIDVSGDTTNNYIYGGAGHDRFDISAGFNQFEGGAGNDTFNVSGDYNIIDAGAGNDYISISGNETEVDAGSGNDTIIIKEGSINDEGYNIQGGTGNDRFELYADDVDVLDKAGNDTYYIDDLSSGYYINDSKGKDTLIINESKEDLSLQRFNIQLNQKGKTVDLDQIDISFSTEDGDVTVSEYFGSGCIERIETADGYYITKEQMNNVAQEVAAWLASNDFYNVEQCMFGSNKGTDEQITELNAIFENINWQM